MVFLNLIIRKRDGVVFKGDVRSISSVNDRGPFDILSMHTNFVSVIRDRINVVKENGQSHNISISRGIIRVKENQVEIYLGI
jgi:F0F1-type ATP synthase epsilon subunit